MVVQDQGVLTKPLGYLDGSSSKKQHRGSVDLDGVDADETYKAVLWQLYAFAEGGKENAVGKFLDSSKERALDDWFDEKKSANAAGCDVSSEAHENVSRQRVDADEKEEDFDPDYELFFRNLKPCGNAYTIELASKNSTLIAKYEDKDHDEFHSRDEPRRKVRKSRPTCSNSTHSRRRHHSVGESRNLNIGPRNSSRYQGRDTMGSQRNTTRCCSRSSKPTSRLADGPRWNGKRKAGDKEKDEIPDHRRSSRRVPGELPIEDERRDDLQGKKSLRDDCLANMNLPRRSGGPRKAKKDKERVQSPHLPEDKDYAMFRKQMKFFGDNFVYVDEDGTEYSYITDGCTDVGLQMNVESLAKPPSSSGRMTQEPSNKRLKSSDKRAPSDGMEVVASAKPPPSSGRKGQEPSNKRLRSSDERVPSDQKNVVSSAKRSSSSDRKTPETSKKRLRLTLSDERVPSDQKNVVASAKRSSSSDRKTPETSKKRLRLTLSDEKVPSNKMNVVGSAKPPSSSRRMTPVASNKRLESFDKRVLSDPTNIQGALSEFRKMAMEIFVKPYDSKEHSELLKEAKLRRPVMHYKETRGRSISFPDEVEVDKSYLDRYPDLRKEIEAAKHDPHEVLYLLRVFFLYLQCLCMENSFIPWKDQSWLEALRKSTSKQ